MTAPPKPVARTGDRRGDDATSTLDDLRSGRRSAREVMETAADRADRAHPHLNAIIHPELDRALDLATEPAAPRGALAGLPIVVKDLGCEQRGRPHHHGARFLKDIGWVGTTDSYLWRTLSDAGAISLGRTNTPEFGSTITTEPAAYGPTRNPWNLAFSPGGSSGGTAAAVAAGIVSLGHGNDGGGSIRIPASACGLVGLKATRGRVSVGPDAGEHRGGFAVDGALVRTTRDAALALDVMTRRWPDDPLPPPDRPDSFRPFASQDPPRLRIGTTSVGAHAECVAAVDGAASLLDALGHDVAPDAAPPDWFDPEVTDQTIVVRTVGMARELDLWAQRIGRPLTEDDVEQSNWWSAEIGRTLPGTMYAAAREWLAGWSRRCCDHFGSIDVLLAPVLGAPPPPLGHLSDPVEGQVRLRELIGFVDQANVTGQPAISVPTALSRDGLPIGVQLIARHGDEGTLLQLSGQLERAGAFIALPDLGSRW